MNEIKEIILHCSDSPLGRGDTAKTIHQWHLERGWDGIGYHYVIDDDGTVENGRPEYWMGAHVSGHNENSLGICLIGMGKYTNRQFLSLVNLLDHLLKKYPKAFIYEHTYFNKEKKCPSLNEIQLKLLYYFFENRFEKRTDSP